MRKIGKYLSGFIFVVIVLGGTFFGGYCYGIKVNEPKAEVVEEHGTSDFDLKLPGEVEKRIVTKGEIVSKLYEIGELSTYCGVYDVLDDSVADPRNIFGLEIPGTRNTITINCTGNVKVGYDISEIVVDVKEDTIYISLPEAHVTDNYIIWDSVKCEEKNNIFNPIEFSQYQEIVRRIEADGLAEVESEGIYAKADENFKKIIKTFLSEFDDYEIVFM